MYSISHYSIKIGPIQCNFNKSWNLAFCRLNELEMFCFAGDGVVLPSFVQATLPGAWGDSVKTVRT